MTNNEVHERLIEWLGDLLGVTVIKDRQQAQRPAMPYGMVDLANWREMREHPRDELYAEADGVVTAQAEIEMEWVFLFMTYGSQAEDLMRKLQSAVHLKQAQWGLLQDGLIIHELSGVNSIPELVGEYWEPRAQLNIVVHGMSSGDGVVIDTIEEHAFNIAGERA